VDQTTSSAYLTELHLIDGQQLTPSSFTEVSATTGQLIPKAYSGTYGTNGFYLKFADNSGTPTGSANWGQRAFAYTAPSGFKALCDTNLGAPVVAKPNTAFDGLLLNMTGNGSTQTISMAWAFQPGSGVAERSISDIKPSFIRPDSRRHQIHL
jgi:hypothetical protein